MTRETIVNLLGEPDDTGGTSRKHRRPSVYLYGIVEVHLDSDTRTLCNRIFVDYEKPGNHPFRFCAACPIGDWDWTPETTQVEVKTYLRAHNLVWTETTLLTRMLRVMASAIAISFNEDGFLGAISTG